MDTPRESADEEVTQLRGCLNDLVSIMALPALWTGSEPPQIVGTLLDALLEMLRLAFVFARLNDPEAGGSIETVRFTESLAGSARERELSEAIDASLGDVPLEWPPRGRIRLGDADLCVAAVRLELQGAIGVIVAGSRRRDFPRDTEMLLLDAAAKQAAIALGQAHRLRKQTRLAGGIQELAHVARVTSLSALTASIAHEVNQPLSGIITNASTCLRMLDATPPDVDGARETARRTIRDGNRAADMITRLRALFSKKEFTLEPLDLNEATREVIALSLSELQRNQVILQPELADDLPLITGDRVQLQQVIQNLLRNASDAMAGVDDRPRHLLIRTEREDAHVRVTVRDAGVGIEPQRMDKLFDAFYTTKSGGMGIGLALSRSIVEKHHGRLWVEPNEGPGTTFAFSIPRNRERVTARDP